MGKLVDENPQNETQFQQNAEDLLTRCLDLGLSDPSITASIDIKKGVPVLNPGLGDIQIAEVTTIGHSGKYLQAYHWENLLPMLRAGEELLWIVRKTGNKFQLYLGLKAAGGFISSPDTVRNRRSHFSAILEQFRRRSFPSSLVRELKSNETARILLETRKLAPEGAGVTMVSGLPSHKTLSPDDLIAVRDDQKRPYASVNDALEAFIDSQDFAIVFSLCPATPAELNTRIRAATDLRTRISSQVRTQEGKTTEKHEESAEIQGRSVSQAKSHEEGTSDTRTHSVNVSAQGSFMGVRIGGGYSHSKAHTTQVSYSTTDTDTESSQLSRGIGTSESKNITLTKINAWLELKDKHLATVIDHLTDAGGTQAYFGLISIFSGSPELGNRIGKALAGSLAGSHTHLHPFHVIQYGGRDPDFQLNYAVSAKDGIRGIAILKPEHACQLVMLPGSDLPGVHLKQNVFYGLPDRPSGTEFTQLGTSAYLQPLPSPYKKETNDCAEPTRSTAVSIPSEDMLTHVLITGTTGSGKTLRAIEILNGLDPEKFRIVVFETAKKTYRQYLCRQGQRPRILALGGSAGAERFRINPFYCDNPPLLKRHVSILADALADLLPMEALIGPKLREGILNAYYSFGWNIDTGEFSGKGTPSFPSLVDFNIEMKRIASALNYSEEINQNYRGALLGRARLFLDDLYQDIFSHDGCASIDDLLATDTVFELDDLPPSEINMPAFLVSILLERLRASQAKKAASDRKKIIVVIEEAHNLLGRQLEERQQQDETGGAHFLLKQLVRLLQEGREIGIGMMIVDQSPQNLSSAVLKNTNTKLVHRLVDGDELRVVGSAIGLREEEWPDLMELRERECVLKTRSEGKALLLASAPIPERLPSLSGAPALVPNYFLGRQLIERALAEFDSTFQLHEVCESLLREACFGRIDLLNHMIGRYAVFNDLVPESEKWPKITTKIEATRGLIALTSGRVSRETEFSQRLVSLLLRTPRFSPSDMLNSQLFGVDWEEKEVEELLQRFVRYAEQIEMPQDKLQKAITTLRAWAIGSRNQGGSPEVSAMMLREFGVRGAAGATLFRALLEPCLLDYQKHRMRRRNYLLVLAYGRRLAIGTE